MKILPNFDSIIKYSNYYNTVPIWTVLPMNFTPIGVIKKIRSISKHCFMLESREDSLFRGLPVKIEVARYHSLAADENTMPNCLKVIARSDDGEIMAVRHRSRNIWGVQFHPESIMTPKGINILQNFLGGRNNAESVS